MYKIEEDLVFNSHSKINIKKVVIVTPYSGGRSHFRVQNKESQTP